MLNAGRVRASVKSKNSKFREEERKNLVRTRFFYTPVKKTFLNECSHPSSSFLTVFTVFLSFGSVWLLLAWGDTWTLHIFQLLQDDTSIRAFARRFAVSPSTVTRAWGKFQETSSYSVIAGHDCRRSLTHQHDWYLLIFARRNKMRTAQALQHDSQQGTAVKVADQTFSNILYEGGLSILSRALCSLPSTMSPIGICHRIPKLAGPQLALGTFYRLEQVLHQHM